MTEPLLPYTVWEFATIVGGACAGAAHWFAYDAVAAKFEGVLNG